MGRGPLAASLPSACCSCPDLQAVSVPAMISLASSLNHLERPHLRQQLRAPEYQALGVAAALSHLPHAPWHQSVPPGCCFHVGGLGDGLLSAPLLSVVRRCSSWEEWRRHEGQGQFPQESLDARPTFRTCSVCSLIRSLSWMYKAKSMFGSSPAVLRNPKVTSVTCRASQASG